jgi:hypothetical protein
MSLFFALALVSIIVSVFLDRYKGVAGLFTLASLTTAILVYTKYVAVVFHYDILVEDEAEPLFVVRQTVGKRNVTLCRVAFADITKIEKETAEQRRAHKTEVGTARYVYAPTLFPDVSYRISLASKREKAEIIVEGSDEFSQMLLEVAKSARELRAASADDEE